MSTIHIFDMDDTLIVTPKLADFVKSDESGMVLSGEEFEEKTLGNNNHELFNKIKQQFLIFFSKEIYLKKTGDFIVLYDHKTNRPVPSYFLNHIEEFVKKVEKEKPDKVASIFGAKRGDIRRMVKWFEEKDGVLTLMEPAGFHDHPETIGNILNKEVVEAYDSAKNKMILTGRSSKLYDVIAKNLTLINLDFPNFGLYCYNGKNSIKEFKAETVSNSILENNWENIHLYEDRSNWLTFIEESINDKHPRVNFVGHLIQNVRDNRFL